MLAKAEALWQRAFDSVFDLCDAVCRPLWADTPPSPVQRLLRNAPWRPAEPGSLEPFVQAIRECPFRSRKMALLKTLAEAVPEGEEMLASLLTDPELGPVVLFARKGDRGPDEVAPEEALWLMAANILQFLELGGPDAVREQLGKLCRAAREDIVLAVSDSGYPARETLEEFRTLVAEPIQAEDVTVIRSAWRQHAAVRA